MKVVKATQVTAGLAESNGSPLPGLWRDSLHVTCGLTACTPGSAPGPTLGNEYGKTLPFHLFAGLGSGDEVRLLDYLFERQGYNPLVRPVANLSDTVPSTRPTLCRESFANLSDTVPSTRPTQCRESVANLTDTVRVQLGMALIQLIDVVSLHECLGLTLPRRAILNAALLKPEMYNASQRRRSRTEPQTPVKIGRVVPVISRRTDRQTDRQESVATRSCQYKGRSRIFVCSGGSAPGGSPHHPPNRG